RHWNGARRHHARAGPVCSAFQGRSRPVGLDNPCRPAAKLSRTGSSRYPRGRVPARGGASMTGQRTVGCAAGVLAPTVPASQRASAGDKEIPLGAKIANLHFKDIHYLPRSLDDFGKKKALVLVFTNTTCPVVQRYMPILKSLEKDYRGKDVQFI